MEISKHDNLDTEKMFTISTAHITRETGDWLDANLDYLPVYLKGNYGWYIYVNSTWFGEGSKAPEDLIYLLQFCIINKIDVLCLDMAAETFDELPEYDWFDDDGEEE